ncbi:MAG: helicase-associated domain-containing protein [Planctomycetes bacterium]|nr:helicase-associated domain-containing protein [Planctomycetota bacterium]MCW8134998.1 helicase-associated domain-containing protein [Planctomycetota bacterium]
MPDTRGPAIVQADLTILLEVDHPQYEQARDALAAFAELVKSPEHIHTYRITPLSLWNAASSGITAARVLDDLARFSRYAVPDVVRSEVLEYIGRYGRLVLERDAQGLILRSDDKVLLKMLASQKGVERYFGAFIDDHTARIEQSARGYLKQALVKIGFPVEDLAGYTPGAALDVQLRGTALSGRDFGLRRYQKEAADVFYAGGGVKGGSGAVVLPCGAGKTIVAMAAMSLVKAHTLILTANVVAVRQWIRELVDKTNLREDQVAEYTGESKNIAPVTVATYQIVTYRKRKSEEFPHFEIFNRGDWGLIIYDEVHLLPAPVFRATAEIQSRRRLGLTATLVREDGLEEDVFSLVGPKRYDVPWRELEKQGWIAEADCTEVRVDLPGSQRMPYAVAGQRDQYRIAAENPVKLDVTEAIMKLHKTDRILVIAQYLDQLHELAQRFELPLIEGKTPSRTRDVLYAKFRAGEIKALAVSKVGNFAVDLPDANVMIQLSGTFGSRQEEAQRLGRILRPKSEGQLAHFYTIVTRETRDQEFGANRQLFLVEQGYRYRILEAADITEGRFTPQTGACEVPGPDATPALQSSTEHP